MWALPRTRRFFQPTWTAPTGQAERERKRELCGHNSQLIVKPHILVNAEWEIAQALL